MARYAVGEPDISRLSSGITTTKEYVETKNLGELFREAKAKHSATGKRKRKVSAKQQKFRQENEKGYGIYRLTQCKNGVWRYVCQGRTKFHDIQSSNILDLKKEVRSRNLMWQVYDEDLARRTAKKAGVDYNRLV